VTMLATARVSSLGLQRVEEALEEMRDGIASGYEPVEADRRFHLSIAQLSANSMLVEMIRALFDAWHPISSRTRMRVGTARKWQAVLHEHESILRALELRHPQAAAAQMCLHLQSSHGLWIGGPTTPNSPSVRSSQRGDPSLDEKGARSDSVRRNLICPIDSAANHSRLGSFELEPVGANLDSRPQPQPEPARAGHPACPRRRHAHPGR